MAGEVSYIGSPPAGAQVNPGGDLHHRRVCMVVQFEHFIGCNRLH